MYVTFSNYMLLASINFLASLITPLPLVPLTTPKLSQSSAHTLKLKCLWLHEDGVYNATDLEFKYLLHSKHVYCVLFSIIQTLKLS